MHRLVIDLTLHMMELLGIMTLCVPGCYLSSIFDEFDY